MLTSNASIQILNFLSKNLHKFWREFDFYVGKNNRLDVLKKYGLIGHKKYKRTEQEREEFERVRNSIDFKKYGTCKSCGFNGKTIVHHIIMLKSRGLNVGKNLIEICNRCHSEIHPWLKNNGLT